MSHFIIHGRRPLSGSIDVLGSKNAALPLLAASLLTEDELHLTNIPPIMDVERMLHILRDCGVAAAMQDDRVTLQAGKVDHERIPQDLVGMLRGSLLLIGAFLGRQRTVRLNRPGGDVIGARPLDTHLDALRQLGARIEETDHSIQIDGSAMQAGRVVLREFSVTATENTMLAAATLPGTTTIHLAATEPHIVALAVLLQRMGAAVTGAGTHTIGIAGNEHLHGAQYDNIPDMLEAGFFILLGAATGSKLEIRNVPVDDLLILFKKLEDVGIAHTVNWETGVVRVEPSQLRSFRVQTLPHPGLATDLQAPFSVLATQASGSTLIHDPLYERRFQHIVELQKMGAQAVVCDPHRVIITGPTPLRGQRIPSLDIRSGATLIMAGLVADGETIIENASIIDRGYVRLDERLVALGADIRRVEAV